jgi:two-component system chemotaxis response regulator CheY
LKELLIYRGYEIAGIANNGEKAVFMFKSFLEKPKVILMDYRMPIKNGIETTKEILQINTTIKIIFMSADESVKEEALAIGAFCFVDKPFDIELLITSIKKALEISSI